MMKPTVPLAVCLLAALLIVPPTLLAQPSPTTIARSSEAPPSLEIRTGDQLAVRILREPEWSGVFTVAETGEVVLPRLGRFLVSTLPTGAVQDSLNSRYAEYLIDPVVEVTVLRRIAVHGEVRRPDLYMVDLTMTLQDVIAKAGGVTEVGNPHRVMIVRDGEQLRVEPGESTRLLAAELRSGDQVVVGRRSWMSVNALGIISTSAVAVSVFYPLIRSALRRE
jgi:polysaccharide biosynthesis/export protein VpsN